MLDRLWVNHKTGVIGQVYQPGPGVLACSRASYLRLGPEMFLAEKTVKNYVSSLLQKMGFSRRTEAAVYATRSKGGQRPEG